MAHSIHGIQKISKIIRYMNLKIDILKLSLNKMHNQENIKYKSLKFRITQIILQKLVINKNMEKIK